MKQTTIQYPAYYVSLSEEELTVLSGGGIESAMVQIVNMGKVFTYIGKIFSAVGVLAVSINSIYVNFVTLREFVNTNY